MKSNGIVKDAVELGELMVDDIKTEVKEKVKKEELKLKVDQFKQEVGQIKDDVKEKVIEKIEQL
ncbi:MAG: hypothetical protein ATN35_12125 [Epulopiscium sp. Nele67-Bin004]|nr:MAG: hypothetical protein ATN35_12125 [Epulopiscium sp. Nele67-Bin004]